MLRSLIFKKKYTVLTDSEGINKRVDFRGENPSPFQPPDNSGVTFRSLPINDLDTMARPQIPESKSAIQRATDQPSVDELQASHRIEMTAQCLYARAVIRPHLE